jgi:hypothetical protein
MKFSTLRLSRSSLELFQQCSRCFWLDQHHKIGRPRGFPYTLSSAVDFLVKQEFDKYRREGTLPPILMRHNIRAKLFNGPELPVWRENFKGIQYVDEDLNAMLCGAVDDILEFPDASLAVVDYKSSGSREIKIYDDYKRQMDVYNWLLQRKGYQTQAEAYFVVYQVDKTGGGFQNALPFREELRVIKTNPEWVGDVFEQAVIVARRETPPDLETPCEHCIYVQKASSFFPAPVKKRASKLKTPVEESIVFVE